MLAITSVKIIIIEWKINNHNANIGFGHNFSWKF